MISPVPVLSSICNAHTHTAANSKSRALGQRIPWANHRLPGLPEPGVRFSDGMQIWANFDDRPMISMRNGLTHHPVTVQCYSIPVLIHTVQHPTLMLWMLFGAVELKSRICLTVQYRT